MAETTYTSITSNGIETTTVTVPDHDQSPTKEDSEQIVSEVNIVFLT